MTISKKTKALTAAGFVASMAVLTPMVKSLEGRSLAAYLDEVGVPTICDGETNGVKIGQTKTDKECDALLQGRLGQALRFVDRTVDLDLSPYQRAGLASFVYNVGDGAFLRSSILRELNKGNVLEGCNRIMRYTLLKAPKGSMADKRDGKEDGYKDCKISSNKCGGIARRRHQEKQLCLRW